MSHLFLWSMSMFISREYQKIHFKYCICFLFLLSSISHDGYGFFRIFSTKKHNFFHQIFIFARNLFYSQHLIVKFNTFLIIVNNQKKQHSMMSNSKIFDRKMHNTDLTQSIQYNGIERQELVTKPNCTDSNSVFNWIACFPSADTLPLSLLKYNSCSALDVHCKKKKTDAFHSISSILPNASDLFEGWEPYTNGTIVCVCEEFNSQKCG